MRQKDLDLFLKVMMFIFPLTCQAQLGNIWIFGNRAGINFNATLPNALVSSINSTESCASVCDGNGQLLFYTDGMNIWNNQHQLMNNGTGLTPLFGGAPTTSTSQGSVIIPIPETVHKYYVFSLTSAEQARNGGRLYYSIVDMSLGNGLGDVLPNKKAIFVDSGLVEKMTGIVGDQCNIWLLTCTQKSKFRAYEITAEGISPFPVESTVGMGSNAFPAGCFAVAPNRRKVAATALGPFASGINGLGLYDFDPGSGMVSNMIQLFPFSNGYGVCFSPDNSKLYANRGSNSNQIVQFDLSSENATLMLASMTVVGTTNAGITQLKAAPDGKIYFNDGNNTLGSISFPDLKGNAAQFSNNVLFLAAPGATGYGLPSTIPIVQRDTVISSNPIEASCFGDNIHLVATDSIKGWNYQWSTGSAKPSITVQSPGKYWVTYHSSPCIHHVDTFLVHFPNGALPQLKIQSNCKEGTNGKAWFSVPSWDTTPYYYKWRNVNDTSVLSYFDTLQRVSSGNYTVQLTTGNGCDTTLNLYIPEEVYKASFIADTISCENKEIQFLNTSDSHFANFYWSFGDSNSTVVEGGNPKHIYPDSGTYEVRLVAMGAVCTDTVTKTIVVDASVEGIYFTMSKDSLCIGESVTFAADETYTATSFLWDYGDESKAINNNGVNSHSYDKVGRMAVKLTARFRACSDISYIDTVCVWPHPLVDLGPDTVLCIHENQIKLYNQAIGHASTYRYTWSTGETRDSIIIKSW